MPDVTITIGQQRWNRLTAALAGQQDYPPLPVLATDPDGFPIEFGPRPTLTADHVREWLAICLRNIVWGYERNVSYDQAHSSVDAVLKNERWS